MKHPIMGVWMRIRYEWEGFSDKCIELGHKNYKNIIWNKKSKQFVSNGL